jgi:hypothetical protein
MADVGTFDADWFRRAWWGQLSLTTSFWKIFVVGYLSSAIVGGFLYVLVYLVCPPVARLSLLTVFGVYPLWATVCVWRSANSGKCTPIWGVSAKGISGFYSIIILYRVVMHSQQIMEMISAR